MTPIEQMPIEQTIAQLEQWIERIQREKDWRAQQLNAGELRNYEAAFVVSRLMRLDDELAEVRALLENQLQVRNHFALLLPMRPDAITVPAPPPTMLKAGLRVEPERKRA